MRDGLADGCDLRHGVTDGLSPRVDHPVRYIAAAIGELKAKRGRELQVHGSGALTRWLLESRAFSKGIMIPVYRATGRPQYAT